MFEFSWGGVEVCSMLVTEGQMLAYVKKNHVLGTMNTEAVLASQGLKASWYNLASEVRESEKRSASFLNPVFLHKVLSLSDVRRRKYRQLVAQMGKADFGKADDSELSDWYLRLGSSICGILGGYQVTQPEFLKQPELRLKRIISQNGGLDLGRAFADLTTYTRLDAINLEEGTFYALKQNGAGREELERHVGKFPWLMLNTYDLEDALRYLKARLESSVVPKSIERAKEEKKELKERQGEILDLLDDSQAKYFSNLFGELAFMRVEEKTCWASATWLAMPLLREISLRKGEKVGDIANLYRLGEVEALIKQNRKLGADELKRRGESYLYHYKRPKLEFHSGHEARTLKDGMLGGIDKPQHVKTIKGICASPGRATGRVRIIVTEGLDGYLKELHQFRKGEVLVTGMTQITMTPICSKAAAIVTNEGGMTSHAAIISRELKIPCVVGTHVATRELKTGDLIEVDAERGTVSFV
ncbi:hypothetical protein HY995_01080 [Candidatus Micrarchaeota archaeon]|nr:hypothetical protein [Candidatus Micrarchaeota archaeon]